MAWDRAGLDVFADSHVERIVIRDGRAVGVVVDGEELRAERVILAAGALGTPAILWRPDRPGCRAAPAGHRGPRGPARGRRGTGQPAAHRRVPGPQAGWENEGASTGQIVLRTTSSGAHRRENDMYYAMANRFDLAHHFPELRKDADGSIVFGVMAVARRAHSRAGASPCRRRTRPYRPASTWDTCPTSRTTR
ncbi:GMC family oxidoreductase N-terminal domain-containing protein [Nonomuraea sp. M3C6]|uniref:GMC family oxidoreductase N-terminal domain-containing protein n=1 Tax=Nonomuraea marmarensis TaxID=3351344 RepID=A0ABW7ATU0_9ACTN